MRKLALVPMTPTNILDPVALTEFKARKNPLVCVKDHVPGKNDMFYLSCNQDYLITLCSAQ